MCRMITAELQWVIIFWLPVPSGHFFRIDIKFKHKWNKCAHWGFNKDGQKFQVTPDESSEMTHFLSKKVFKSDSKIDYVYLVRFWGGYHLLDAQMTILGCPAGLQRAGNGTQLPVHVEIHLHTDPWFSQGSTNFFQNFSLILELDQTNHPFVDPWINCDKCTIWYHLTCVQISRKEIPEIFMCSKCEPKEDGERPRKLKWRRMAIDP